MRCPWWSMFSCIWGVFRTCYSIRISKACVYKYIFPILWPVFLSVKPESLWNWKLRVSFEATCSGHNLSTSVLSLEICLLPLCTAEFWVLFSVDGACLVKSLYIDIRMWLWSYFVCVPLHSGLVCSLLKVLKLYLHICQGVVCPFIQ